MKKIILLFWLISVQVFAQKIYEQNEVEKPAEPSGNVSMLNHFITSNTQLPIISASKGVNGRVFIKGIVEPDGSFSDLKVIRGIDNATDAEAIRIMSLYKAWKPAQIKGIEVRQALTYPVSFKVAATSNFDSVQNALIYYFDKTETPTQDVNAAKFRTLIPVDSHGLINADVQYQKLKGDKWKTANTIAVLKKREWYQIHSEGKSDSVEVLNISIPHEDGSKMFQEVSLKSDGKLVSYTDYNTNGGLSVKKRYYLNGGLRETFEYTDSLVLHTGWYEKGHMRFAIQFHEGPDRDRELIVKGVWDKGGNSLLNDGKGWCYLPSGDFMGQSVWEEGYVINGLKSGKWIGKTADSTLRYEEYYVDGKLEKGTAFNGSEKTEYTSGIKQPAFEGGVSAMYRFLGMNIVYPINAAKSRVTGRVLLSFVVCEDGSLCDYKVTKAVEQSLDNEALRVVKAMNGKWKPGMYKGRNVRVKYNLPINFQLN